MEPKEFTHNLSNSSIISIHIITAQKKLIDEDILIYGFLSFDRDRTKIKIPSWKSSIV